MPTDSEFTKILKWPGYQVYRHEIDEKAKVPRLWVRRQAGEGVAVAQQGALLQEVRRGGGACLRERSGSAGGTAVGLGVQYGAGDRSALPGALGRDAAQAGVAAHGVDEIHLGKKQKFLTVVSNLESSELLWFGQERKKETLDEFFRSQLSARQRRGIEAARVDMWEPYRRSTEEWAPNCQIVYDKFHVMQHANGAIDEVRRAEFFRKGGRLRGLLKGKRWLLLTRWVNLNWAKRQELNHLFALNRKLLKAYLLKESLDRLWSYHYEGAMLHYLLLKAQRMAVINPLAP